MNKSVELTSLIEDCPNFCLYIQLPLLEVLSGSGSEYIHRSITPSFQPSQPSKRYWDQHQQQQ